MVKPLFGWLLLSPTSASTEGSSVMEDGEGIDSSLRTPAEGVDSAPQFLSSDLNIGESSLSEVEAILWLPSQKVKACLLSGSPPLSALLCQPVVKHHRFQVGLKLTVLLLLCT